MIVGSRGDVQPYVALGKRLKQNGHRIRIASHENFRSFVNDNGLDFYSIGGDPHELMSYMVKNPGLVPGMESLTNGDIPKKRKMLQGCWESCFSPDETTGAPFMADAIISNPPAFAHVHCAEALGIPLLLSFTMPWCATGAFPHPLVNVKFSNAGERLTNHMSYAVADMLTWQGMGDIINKFRNRALGLPSLSVRSGPGLAERLKVPWTYCMSPALVPKPKDWSNHIDVVGFYFLDLATSFTPPDDLASFLASGETPVYIGFGSVVVDDPEEMSRIIFEATAQAGVRAIVSAGWGGLGGLEVPPHVYIVGNVPHDWLFAEGRVSAVVHHGGAGTTAIGLSKGRPTVIVPFFGDQEFWGDMIHRAGAGPAPIPHRKLTVENLTDALVYATSPPAQGAAAKMARQIATEDGVAAGAESFYRHLPLLNMRCDVCPDKVAVWWSTDQCLKLSALAAQTLIEARELKLESLDLHRTKEYESRKKFRDPLTACAGGLFWTILQCEAGLVELFTCVLMRYRSFPN
ncbi:glycosyltransferase family 1 protein [Schizophyllum commune]